MHIATKPNATSIAARPYPLNTIIFRNKNIKTYLMPESSERACPHGQVP